MKDYKGGIYMWTAIKTGHSYIGKTVDLERRKKEFLCFSKTRYSGKAINWARKKYQSPDLWEYKILEKCAKKDLSEREIFYIKRFQTFKNGYNENEGGDGNKGFILSEEIKRKISKSLKKRPPVTEETKLKISRSLMGHKVNEDERKKISETLKNYFENHDNPNYGKRGKECTWCRIIGQFDTLNGDLIKIWYGTKEIERENEGYKGPFIINVCRGRKKTAYGFVWKYIDIK